MRLVGYVGGGGQPPVDSLGYYVGSRGYTADPEEAVDVSRPVPVQSAAEEWLAAREAVLAEPSADVRTNPSAAGTWDRLANAEETLARAVRPSR